MYCFSMISTITFLVRKKLGVKFGPWTDFQFFFFFWQKPFANTYIFFNDLYQHIFQQEKF
jgi:hypothetical protein